MSNDISEALSVGEIQVFDPGMPVLAPLSPSPETWGDRTDLLQDHQAPTISLFGAALPAGTTETQLQATLHALGQRFEADFQTLGYPANLTAFAVKFVQQSAMKPPRQVRANHNFELPSELSGDWLANAFCNRLEGLAGTPVQKAQFLAAAIKWLAKASLQLNSRASGPVTPAPRMAPNSTEMLLAGLSDKDFNAVLKINEQAQARTLQTLADKHGEHMARSMVELAQRQLELLTPHERAHFDQFTTVDGQGWISMLNTVTAIEYLYNAHIGAGSIGNGADINKEIAQYEAMLKVPSERARYYKDPAMQARLRELYARREG